MGEIRNAYKILVEKSEGKILRHKWEDNIRTSLGNGVGSCGLDSSDSKRD
jgi:hypothetical protein